MQTPITLTGQLESPHGTPLGQENARGRGWACVRVSRAMSKRQWPAVQPSDSKGLQPLRICMSDRCAVGGQALLRMRGPY
jgi:hypothetical protein